jgi:thiol-disulfide isomerase/thioredoxin
VTGAPAAPEAGTRSAAPVVALALAIVGLLASPLVLGGPVAVTGAVVGAVALRRRRSPRGPAVAGVAVGAAGAASAVAFLGLYLLVARSLGGGATADFADWRGRPAPAITVPLLDGGAVTLADGTSGPRSLVVFWATWCGPCRREIPDLNRLHDEYGDRIRLVAISDEAPELLEKARARHGIRYPIASADGLPSPFGDVRAIPTVFVLDERGVVEDVLVGYQGYAPLLAAATGPARN